MPKLTPQQLKEIYTKLPEDLKDAIFSVDSAEIIQVIGNKYKLAIDKTGKLADETGLVMLGLTHPNNFISNLARRLNTDKETARKIGEEINTQIFARIRESLKKIHGVEPSPPTPASPAGGPLPEGEGPGVRKEEILREIEREEIAPTLAEGEVGVPTPKDVGKKDETKEEVPGILRGTTELHPFEAKTKEEVLRLPPEEKKYSEKDPYREPIE